MLNKRCHDSRCTTRRSLVVIQTSRSIVGHHSNSLISSETGLSISFINHLFFWLHPLSSGSLEEALSSPPRFGISSSSIFAIFFFCSLYCTLGVGITQEVLNVGWKMNRWGVDRGVLVGGGGECSWRLFGEEEFEWGHRLDV